jgi:hypothetical protein
LFAFLIKKGRVMINPNDNLEDEFGETDTETVAEREAVKEKPVAVSPAPASSTAKKDIKITIDRKELDDYSAEVNRLATMLNDTNAKLNRIEKNVSIIDKLEAVARLDLEELETGIKEQMHNLDMSFLIKNAIKLEMQPLLKEYNKNNDLLSNIVKSDDWQVVSKSAEKNKPTFLQKIKKLMIYLLISLLLVSAGFFTNHFFPNLMPKKTVVKKKYDAVVFKVDTRYYSIDTNKMRGRIKKDIKLKGKIKGRRFYPQSNQSNQSIYFFLEDGKIVK